MEGIVRQHDWHLDGSERGELLLLVIAGTKILWVWVPMAFIGRVRFMSAFLMVHLILVSLHPTILWTFIIATKANPSASSVPPNKPVEVITAANPQNHLRKLWRNSEWGRVFFCWCYAFPFAPLGLNSESFMSAGVSFHSTACLISCHPYVVSRCWARSPIGTADIWQAVQRSVTPEMEQLHFFQQFLCHFPEIHYLCTFISLV